MSRAQSPQQLFLGSVVTSMISPQQNALEQFVAFAESSPASTPSCYSIGTPALSPALRALSLSMEEAPRVAPPLDDDSDGEGALSPPVSARCSLDATQPFIATMPSVVLPQCRRQTAVFFEDPKKGSEAPLYRLREATVDDALAILELTAALDMTNATSYVWPLPDLCQRILQRNPLTIVAVQENSAVIAGCAGIDTSGMYAPLRVLSIGSKTSGCGVNEEYDVPQEFCMCRGLLIHPEHQSAGLGSRLHRYRIECLARLFPSVPAVVLSARGSSMEEAVSTLGPLMEQPRENDTTPQFSKDIIFQFTFRTSQGVVHLAHHREKDGWKFVGVDVSDGGPVWCTALPLNEIVRRYPQSRRNTAVLLEPIRMTQG